MQNKYLAVQEALDKSKQALRDRSTAYHQWVDHAKQLREQSEKRSRRIKILEAKLAEVNQDPSNLSFSSNAGDAGVAVAVEPSILTPVHLPHQCIDSNAPTPCPITIFPDHQRAPVPIQGASRSSSPFVTRNLPSTSRSNLSLETVGEKTPSLPPLPQIHEFAEVGTCIKTEPSSDAPVVISERSVRKRKVIGNNEEDIEANRKVKVESDPEFLVTNKRRLFAAHESIDFDAESHRVRTPKKHIKYQQDHYLLNNDQQPSVDESRSACVFEPAVLVRSRLQANGVPVPQSLNIAQFPRAKKSLAPDRMKRNSATIPRGIASLAEDANQNEIVEPIEGKNQVRAGVLTQLLNTPSPALKGSGLGSGRIVKVGEESNIFQIPPTRELPFGKEGRSKLCLSSKGTSDISSSKPASPAAQQIRDTGAAINTSGDKRKMGATSLRRLPKAKLQLDDFKVNPHVNEGYNYAFTDVVRNKDERACLQGCVKENCCGYKFRPLAVAARASTRPYEFQSLLESYLGEDCHRLSTMSEAEKEALWVEAKIRELANQIGKHRHRFPRMPTPPGFWRADFPSTQEGVEYNEEATKLEREMIEERYREAMRPGGVWIFRDE